MLKTRIIPCLDVKDGRTVKGVNFVGLRDAGDPVELARAYSQAGADELCFLDITASHEGRGTLLDVVTRTAEQCFMPLTVGGGVRTPDDMVTQSCAPGRTRWLINSAAVADRMMSFRRALRAAGGNASWWPLMRAIEGGRYEIFTHGGRRATGIDAVEYAREAERRGAGEILLTSMDRDGTRNPASIFPCYRR